MKKILQSGIGILILVMVLYILFLHECRGKKYYVPKGYLIVRQTEWDSINNRVPDTFIVTITDTFIVEKPVYIVHNLPVYIEDTSGLRHYPDSIVNDSIRIWDDLYVRGVVERWDRKYEPIIHIVNKEITVTVPQIIEKPVYEKSSGVYLSGVAGGNTEAFLFGGSLDLVTKKDNLYGIQYQRYGGQNFYSIRIGAKIKIFNKRR